MKTKKLTKVLVSILVISSLFIMWSFFFGGYRYVNFFFEKTYNAIFLRGHTVSPCDTSKGSPLRVRISSIEVNATIEDVGLTPSGLMDTPRGPANVGWFNLGPCPGEKGSAVFVGHFGWKDNIPAVFDNLFKLGKGEKIYVDDENGNAVTFVVWGTKLYDPYADASDVFWSSDGGHTLTLLPVRENGTKLIIVDLNALSCLLIKSRVLSILVASIFRIRRDNKDLFCVATLGILLEIR